MRSVNSNSVAKANILEKENMDSQSANGPRLEQREFVTFFVQELCLISLVFSSNIHTAAMKATNMESFILSD